MEKTRRKGDKERRMAGNVLNYKKSRNSYEFRDLACYGVVLYEMLYEVCTVAREHVDDGNLHHRVASWLQAHRGACHIHQHLTGEGGVVDAHVKLQALVLGLATDTLAHEVYAMTHVTDIVDTRHLEHVGLVACEVGICLDVLLDISELGTLLELYVHHAAMYALTEGDGHRQGVLHSLLGTYAHAVAHRHARDRKSVV